MLLESNRIRYQQSSCERLLLMRTSKPIDRSIADAVLLGYSDGDERNISFAEDPGPTNRSGPKYTGQIILHRGAVDGSSYLAPV